MFFFHLFGKVCPLLASTGVAILIFKLNFFFGKAMAMKVLSIKTKNYKYAKCSITKKYLTSYFRKSNRKCCNNPISFVQS